MNSGHPPIIISQEDRPEYIKSLRSYQFENGIPKAGGAVIVPGKSLDAFRELCGRSWKASLDLVDRMRQRQEDKDLQNGLLDIVAPVPDPEQRRQILNMVRYIYGCTEIKKFAETSLQEATKQKERLEKRRMISDVEGVISKACRKADKFIKELDLPAEIRKGLIKHLKRYESSVNRDVER